MIFVFYLVLALGVSAVIVDAIVQGTPTGGANG